MHGLSYELNAEDQARVEIIACEINAKAESSSQQVVNCYGLDIFQEVEPSFISALRYTCFLYYFPGVAEYIHGFVADDDHISAFENAVALRVHMLMIHRMQPADAEMESVQH
ncbi:MAG: hypothetical protein ABI970_07215 [Chloroflexota bacterium]